MTNLVPKAACEPCAGSLARPSTSLAAVQESQVLDEGVGKQLRALGREVVRAAERFAAGRSTSSEILNGQDQKRVQGAGSS